jgi:hypothetical protein
MEPADGLECLDAPQLGHALPGPEAVVDVTAGEAAGPEPVVDGAEVTLAEVRAGHTGRLVDGEVGGAQKGRAGAAKRNTPRTVGGEPIPAERHKGSR